MTNHTAQQPQNYLENGRLYCNFRKGAYLYPCDEPEQIRMDMMHTIVLELCRNKLHQAPLDNTEDPRILDLGTGTGIWAIDVADTYHKAEVYGIDISNIQPPQIPQNLRFDIGIDYMSPWTFGCSSYDLIYARQALGSVPDWPPLYSKIFTHLKPGTGWLEQVEIDLQPRCDDGSMPHAPMVEWYDHLRDATKMLGRPIQYPHNTEEMLKRAGFVDVNHTVHMVPFNTWPADDNQKKTGRRYCACLLQAIEALSLQPMTKAFGWSVEEIRPMLTALGRAIMNRKVHAYNNVHVWVARRPTG